MKITYSGKEVHAIVRKYAESDVITDVKAKGSKEILIAHEGGHGAAFLGIEVELEEEITEPSA